MVSPYHHYIVQAYFDEQHEDAHTRFAELASIDRQDAKKEFYRWCYHHKFMRPLLESRV